MESRTETGPARRSRLLLVIYLAVAGGPVTGALAAGSGLFNETRLTAPTLQYNSMFGYTVAIDGGTVVVGAANTIGQDGVTTAAGAAYVFARTGASWLQQAKLVLASPAAGDYFGTAVATNGDTIVVGAPALATTSSTPGAAYVYVKTGADWTLQAMLSGSDGRIGDGFGYSAAISGDTVVVGAIGADSPAAQASGAAYVFVREGTTWTQQAKLTAPDGRALDKFDFGRSIAVDGDTVLVGADGGDAPGAGNSGAAYAFVREGVVWSQQAKLVAADARTFGGFGEAVAITADTVVVGAPDYDPSDNVGGDGEGAGYVFVREGTVWTQRAKLTSADGASQGRAGWSVAINAARTVALGVPGATVTGRPAAGAVYLHALSGTTWERGTMLTENRPQVADIFGSSAAFDGNSLVVGAQGTTIAAGWDGAAYVYDLDRLMIHDLAVTKIAVPKTVQLSNSRPSLTKQVAVTVQNRGPAAETIGDLSGLVTLTVDPVVGGCPAPQAVLISGRPNIVPRTLRPNGTFKVFFNVTFDAACIPDPARGAGHQDFSYRASVDRSVLGGQIDTNPANDVCPRYQDPVTYEKGCGGRIPGSSLLGAPVTTDVVHK